MLKFHRLSDALVSLEKEAESKKIISLDVFDTLVYRKIDPNAILGGVASWLDKQGDLAGIGGNPESAIQLYHKAYAKLAAVNTDNGLDFEVYGEQLFEAWVGEKYPGASDQLRVDIHRGLTEEYQDYERWACYPNEQLLQLIRELRDRGKRIIFISDMYLERAIVDSILDQCGMLDLFDAGYVSSEYALLKRTGRLYRQVLQSEGCNPQDMLHFGDNPEADGKMARQESILSIVFRDGYFGRRYTRQKYDWEYFCVDKRWAGFMAAQGAAGPWIKGEIHEEEAYAYRVLGPIFANYIHRVVEQCRDYNIKNVYFIAREGLFLKDLFDNIAPYVFPEGEQPQTHYLYVSRLTAYYLAASQIGLYELSCTQANGPLTVSSLLSPLKIDESCLSQLAAKHGIGCINSPLPPYYQSYPPFQNLLDDPEIKDIVESKNKGQGKLLERYLAESGFFDDSVVGLVDVGWGAQIQNSLYRGLRYRDSGMPTIIGLYLGLNLTAHWRKTPENWSEWVLSDQSHLDWAGMVSLQFPHAFEAIVRAPHGTVVGYREGESGVVEPVFKADDAESRQIEIVNEGLIAQLQNGVKEYVAQYVKAATILGFTASDSRPYALEMLERMIRYPTKSEANLLLRLKNVSDLGSEECIELGGTHPKPAKRTLRGLRRELRNSFWKHGTLAARGARLFGWAWILLVDALRNIPKVGCAVDEGIAFNKPAIDNERKMPERPGGDRSAINSRQVVDNRYIEKFREASAENYASAQQHSGDKVGYRYLSPLTFAEAVQARILFHLARGIGRVFKRHSIYRSGLPLRPLFRRTMFPMDTRTRELLDKAVKVYRRIR